MSRASYHTHRRPSRRLGSLECAGTTALCVSGIASTVAPGKAATRWHSRRRLTSNNLGLSGPRKAVRNCSHLWEGSFGRDKGNTQEGEGGSGWFTLKCDSADDSLLRWQHTWRSLPCVRTARIYHKKHDVSCHPGKIPIHITSRPGGRCVAFWRHPNLKGRSRIPVFTIC